MKRHRSESGFTLLEMVVTVSIVAIISVVLSQVFLATVRTNSKTEVLKDVKQNGDVVLESIIRTVQNATTLTCTSSKSITVENQDGTDTVFACEASGAITRLARTTTAGTSYLTADNITMGGADCTASSLTFSCSDVNGYPAILTVSFDLAPGNIPAAAFEQTSSSFTTTVTMRNQQ